MSKNIVPLQFEIDRNKAAAPPPAAVSGASLPGTSEAAGAGTAAGKAGDIPFAPEGVNRWVGKRPRVSIFHVPVLHFGHRCHKLCIWSHGLSF